MNYCKKKNGKIKLGGNKNGRGYCGWYTNKDGKKIFLRSKKEFIYASYLDKNNQHFLMEQTIFEIGEIRYKPDFFIYDSTYVNLLKIVEIKENRKEAQKYLAYIEYFKNIGIIYEVIYNTDTIKRKWLTDEELSLWTQQYIEKYPKYDMCGELNPMFGIKHKESTKKKIGDQTRKYMKDPTIKQKQKDGLKKFWASPRGIEIRAKNAEYQRLHSPRISPVIERECEYCHKKFLVKQNNPKITCTQSCCAKLNFKKYGPHKINGKLSYSTRLLKYLKIIQPYLQNYAYAEALIICKKNNLIPKNFAMGLNIIEKYFTNLQNAIKLLEDIHG